jgi:hypothetical protein
LAHPLSGATGESRERFLVFLVLACSTFCLAQAPQMKRGATVYIEPMNGYETYLAAAIVKKQVPLTLVTDKEKADYILRGTVSHSQPAQPAVVVNQTTDVNSNNGSGYGQGIAQGMQRAAADDLAAKAARGATSASISLADAHTSQIMFAYAVGKAGTNNQIQSAAEACAKHLKEFIQTPKK